MFVKTYKESITYTSIIFMQNTYDISCIYGCYVMIVLIRISNVCKIPLFLMKYEYILTLHTYYSIFCMQNAYNVYILEEIIVKLYYVRHF